MKEKLKIAYVVFVWAMCIIVLFQTFGNYLTYCAFRLDYRTKCWVTAYQHATASLLDWHARR